MLSVSFLLYCLFLLGDSGYARTEVGSRSQVSDVDRHLEMLNIRAAVNRLEGNFAHHRSARGNATTVNITVELLRRIHEVSDGYLSVTMDAAELRNHLKNVNLSDPRVVNTARGLAPAVFRIGGTDGDYAIFGDNGSNTTTKGSYESPSNFTFSAEIWDEVNTFARKVGWDLVFGLNSKLRSPWPNGAWDTSNAMQLMAYSKKKGYNVSWELGNEPSLYKKPILVTPEQLAKDFKALKHLTETRSISSFTIGPDTLVHEYIHDFLAAVEPGLVDAITYHSYYTSGPTATLADLTNTTLLDTFTPKAVDMAISTSSYQPTSRLWLGETGGLNLGGSPVFSPSYGVGFFWMQTLGMGAVCQLDRVLKQDFLGFDYSLLTPDYQPTPTYWLSYVHKKLVGSRVLYVDGVFKPEKQVRVFAHCAKVESPGSVVLLVMNLRPNVAALRLMNPELSSSSRDVYWLTPPNGNLTSTSVLLNGQLLQLVDNTELPDLKPTEQPASSTITLPPISFGFYVFKDTKAPACLNE